MHAPWVSCWSDTAGKHWNGTQIVRTPLVTSLDGRHKAFAEIRASAVHGAGNCENTVRLFVATDDIAAGASAAGFQEVFKQTPLLGQAGSPATSLAPVAWSPDDRWLVIELADLYYDSDAGGLAVLLYDRRTKKTILPNLDHLAAATLKQKCSVHLLSVRGFDARSQIRLQLADNFEDGNDEPESRCFHGAESWTLDPVKLVLHQSRASR